MKPIFKYLIKHFLQGVLILAPLIITIYAVYYVFFSVDQLIPWFTKISPGVGFVVVISMITLFGYFGDKFFITRWLIDGIDYIFQNIPGIKFIYTSSKDILGSFVGDNKKFTSPVWVKTSQIPEIWRIGFLTQEKLNAKDLPNKISVYLPHSYAISGWVIIVDKENTIPITDMTADQAMKFAISGGVSGNTDSTKELNSTSDQ